MASRPLPPGRRGTGARPPPMGAPAMPQIKWLAADSAPSSQPGSLGTSHATPSSTVRQVKRFGADPAPESQPTNTRTATWPPVKPRETPQSPVDVPAAPRASRLGDGQTQVRQSSNSHAITWPPAVKPRDAWPSPVHAPVTTPAAITPNRQATSPIASQAAPSMPVTKVQNPPSSPARIPPPQSPSPARTTAETKSAGFQAARAMFEANKHRSTPPPPPPPPPPPTPPRRRFAPAPPTPPPNSSASPATVRPAPATAAVEGSAAVGSAAAVPPPELTPPAVLTVEPVPTQKEERRSVKALISKLNAPEAVATDAGLSEQTTSIRVKAVASTPTNAVSSVDSSVLSPPSSGRHEAHEKSVHSMPLDVVAVDSTVQERVALLNPSPPLLQSPAPQSPASAPSVAEHNMNPSQSRTPNAPESKISQVNLTSRTVEVKSVPASPQSVPSAETSDIQFHPFNLLIPVTMVPEIPRTIDCVFDEAAVEMQKNIMKVVKKQFRKRKPQFEEFKINAKLYGNGFMDPDEYLDTLIKDFRPLRALQLVPCLVSIQPDELKREGLLMAARGYRLRNLASLERQCDEMREAEDSQPPASSSPPQTDTAPTPQLAIAQSLSMSTSVADEMEQPHNVGTEVVSDPIASPLATSIASTSDGTTSLSVQSVTGEFQDPAAHQDVNVLGPAEDHDSPSINEEKLVKNDSPEVTVELLSPRDVEPPNDAEIMTNEQQPSSIGVTDTDAKSDLASDKIVALNDSAVSGVETIAVQPTLVESSLEPATPVKTVMPSKVDTDNDPSALEPTHDDNAELNTVNQVESSPLRDDLTKSVSDGRDWEQSSTSSQDEVEAELSPVKVAPAKNSKIPSPSAEKTAVSRVDSFTSDDGEVLEKEDQHTISKNLFGEVIEPKTGEAEPLSTTSTEYSEAESLFGSPASNPVERDDDGPVNLFGEVIRPSSSTSSLSSSSTNTGSNKPRKSVTWGTNEAKEIPARKTRPAPMIFGFATAGAYSDSDSDESDFE